MRLNMNKTTKRTFALLMATTFALSLCACDSKEGNKTEADNTTVSSTATTTEAETEDTTEAIDKTTEAQNEKANISVDFASEDLLANKDSYQLFEESTSEYHVDAVFTTDSTVKDFKYEEVTYEESGEYLKFSASKTLYSLDELTIDKPVVISMLVEGTIPNRGISYVDGDGVVRHFTISTSGEDGSLILAEYE